MNAIENISLKDAISLLPRRPGLVIGEDATTYSGALESVKEKLIDFLPEDARPDAKRRSALDVLDTIRQLNPHKADAASSVFVDYIQGLSPSLDSQHLSRIQWSAVISLTYDLIFESQSRDYLDSIASSRTLTIVDSPTVAVPPRSTPVFKLLGNIFERDPTKQAAIASSDLLIRQQQWPALLRQCGDTLRGCPIFLAGNTTSRDFLRPMLGSLFNQKAAHPKLVLILESDGTLDDPTIQSLLASHCRVMQIDASLRDFCAAIAEMKPKQTAISAFVARSYSNSSQELANRLQEYSSYISIVPDQAGEQVDISMHRNSLTDALFRPLSVDWSPYLAQLDLRRTITDELIVGINGTSASSLPCVLIRGDSAVGKTSVLKRTAVELASQGYVVLWCKRAPSELWHTQYRKLIAKLVQWRKEKPDDTLRVAIFCDDPWATRVTARELLSICDSARLEAVLIFSYRHSDYISLDYANSILPVMPAVDIEIPSTLDAHESDGLQDMLVKIGAAANEGDAAAAIAALPDHAGAKDILCSLWYLIPETKAQITASLQDEYSRLGGASHSIEKFAQAAADSGEVARLAYELVTVTSNLNLMLPIEILVSALGTDYGEWIALCEGGRPVWGLLYSDTDPEQHTVVYRTRNEVVTQVLLRLVNGGQGHAGEYRALKRLVHACDGGSQIYRSFIVDLLVGSRSRIRLHEILTYEQGLELFELAENTLPYPDKLIAHHKGLWIHHAGKKYSEAYEQFEKALTTPSYPGELREDPQEFVHTSMAATMVQRVKDGEQDSETGLRVVQTHLQQASSPTFFNPHTTHVFANLLFELAQRSDSNAADHIALTSLVEALQEIEKTLQIVGAEGRTQIRFQDQIAALNSLQAKIFSSMPSDETLDEIALELFSSISKNQVGIEIAARKRLVDASARDKGRFYNKVSEHLKKTFALVEEANALPTAGLRTVRVDLVVRWKLQRVGGGVDWHSFKHDLDQILKAARFRDDPLRLFHFGVACFHLGDIGNATATFAKLRRSIGPRLLPYDIRCCYIGKEGFPMRLQGVVERKHGRLYASISELGTEVLIKTGESTSGTGGSDHFYIVFSFNGPLAVTDSPKERALLLPGVSVYDA